MRKGTPSEREATPTSPGEQLGGRNPGGDSGETTPAGGEPESPAANREGTQLSAPPSAPSPPAGDNDGWGDLPIHVRELFRAQGGHDLPPHYRDWIDAYYRRLHGKL